MEASDDEDKSYKFRPKDYSFFNPDASSAKPVSLEYRKIFYHTVYPFIEQLRDQYNLNTLDTRIRTTIPLITRKTIVNEFVENIEARRYDFQDIRKKRDQQPDRQVNQTIRQPSPTQILAHKKKEDRSIRIAKIAITASLATKTDRDRGKEENRNYHVLYKSETSSSSSSLLSDDSYYSDNDRDSEDSSKSINAYFLTVDLVPAAMHLSSGLDSPEVPPSRPR
ncbi:hypothetical protein BLS_002380 [Venturia inaequalis]|uniref:Uncharacterized protein n=1 Tax=Venturia inaequalis TaxID=5025 RepID=A0A8H3YI73_VENIN|nr:hypothetical protein BLS_002380 [Venturia inaequalis]